MPVAPSNIRAADDAAIADAAAILRAGGLVAFPTETVYGLGADATNGDAVAAIFAAKKRPRFNPLIVHLRGLEDVNRHVEMHPLAKRLAERFWPGALTLVLPRKVDSPLSLLVSAGLDTVAVRVPNHPVAQRLLAAAERPLAAPSANASGKISPTNAAHVAESLGRNVDCILDGGACALGLESTVIGFEGEHAVLLRPGAIPREEIEAVTGPLQDATEDSHASPGRLLSHYAPHAKMRLNAATTTSDEALLAFGPDVPIGAMVMRNLSARGDLKEAAANLFALLRELDASGAARIAVMPIPHAGLGEAINDRLDRAAAPRGEA